MRMRGHNAQRGDIYENQNTQNLHTQILKPEASEHENINKHNTLHSMKLFFVIRVAGMGYYIYKMGQYLSYAHESFVENLHHVLLLRVIASIVYC